MLTPGMISSVAISFIGGAVMIRRVIRTTSKVTSRSSCALRKLKRMAGGLFGALDDTWMLPVLSDRRMPVIAVTPDFFDSLKFGSARNGIQEIAASGASSPGRVRT